jgi:hypothetical protein
VDVRVTTKGLPRQQPINLPRLCEQDSAVNIFLFFFCLK